MGGTNNNDVEIAEIQAKSQEEQARMYQETSQANRDMWDKIISDQSAVSKANMAQMKDSTAQYYANGSNHVGGSTTIGRS